MADAALTTEPSDVDETPVPNARPFAPRLRTAGYCEGCGTWDAHGLACVSCGYNFSGAENEAANA